MLVFAAETSCDETSVCIMDEDKNIYSHIIFSQEIHKRYGGVVPELASRAHLEILQNITKEAFKESDKKISDIDIFSATCGPGLIGPLLIGSTFVKSLAIGSNKPFVPINHIESHILSPTFNNEIHYPNICLLLTGGHTEIYLLESKKKITLLGETVDDALGETFDKVGKLLNLKYPGGPEIEKKAMNGNETTYELPTPLLNENNLNFSFSGLKTAISQIVKKTDLSNDFIANLSASFQFCVSKILLEKTKKAIKKLEDESKKINSLSVVGGVSNNKYIAKKIIDFFKDKNIEILFPVKDMMSDNAAMIAWNCINKDLNYSKNICFKVDPRLTIK
jgi:N6-L-threonylcarbamoyladenine synthase